MHIFDVFFADSLIHLEWYHYIKNILNILKITVMMELKSLINILIWVHASLRHCICFMESVTVDSTLINWYIFQYRIAFILMFKLI